MVNCVTFNKALVYNIMVILVSLARQHNHSHSRLGPGMSLLHVNFDLTFLCLPLVDISYVVGNPFKAHKPHKLCVNPTIVFQVD